MASLHGKVSDHHKIQDFLKKNKAFQRWSASRLAELAAYSRICRYFRGARISAAGTSRGESCVIVGGRVLLVRPSGSFEEALGLLGSGIVLAGMPEFDLQVEALVLDTTVAIHVNSSLLLKHLECQPQMWSDLVQVLLSQESAMLADLIGRTTGTMTQRVAAAISQQCALGMVQETFDNSGCFQVSQEDCAALLGVSRKTVGKEFKLLEGSGLIVRGYKFIMVPDLTALARFSGMVTSHGSSALLQANPVLVHGRVQAHQG
ncbi:MAG: Crp/Fnr family transcriptional regulator [Acidovorax sp.]|jgi:CRP-like cAMP-binding protein|nr:Crp/Fnr family transcriptional regulator [Acidovorax sp.]